MPGEGEIPLIQFVRNLDSIGSGAPIGVEVINRELAKRAPAEIGRLTAEATRKVLAAARAESVPISEVSSR